VDAPAGVAALSSGTATAVAADTLIRLAQHPRIVAVKDAKGDIAASSQVLAHTDLAYYSGDDPMTLPLLAVGSARQAAEALVAAADDAGGRAHPRCQI